MKHFTQKELARLIGCNPRVIILVYEVKKRFECWIVSGNRSEVEQNKLFIKGVSQLDGSESNESYHQLGLAFDLYPKGYEKTGYDSIPQEKWEEQAEVVEEEAEKLGLRITWGGEWKTIIDKPHFQVEIDT